MYAMASAGRDWRELGVVRNKGPCGLICCKRIREAALAGRKKDGPRAVRDYRTVRQHL